MAQRRECRNVRAAGLETCALRGSSGFSLRRRTWRASWFAVVPESTIYLQTSHHDGQPAQRPILLESVPG